MSLSQQWHNVNNLTFVINRRFPFLEFVYSFFNQISERERDYRGVFRGEIRILYDTYTQTRTHIHVHAYLSLAIDVSGLVCQQGKLEIAISPPVNGESSPLSRQQHHGAIGPTDFLWSLRILLLTSSGGSDYGFVEYLFFCEVYIITLEGVWEK